MRCMSRSRKMSRSNLLNLLAVASILFISCESQTDQPNASTSSSCLTFSQVSCTEGIERWQLSKHTLGVNTRLIPDMKFNCSGTLVGWTVSGRAGNGTLYPKLQIWRRSDSEPFVYHKNGPEIQIDAEGSVCENISKRCDQNFHCNLSPSHQVEVRAGSDIIGLKLPDTDDQGFELYFIAQHGPDLEYFDNRKWKQLVWRGEVNSSSLTLGRQDTEEFDKPLLSLTVLSENIMSSSRSSLLPFGSGTGDKFMLIDSFSSKPLIFDMPFKFFGTKYKQITVNLVGVLSLGGIGFTEYVPREFPFSTFPLISPYWHNFNPYDGGTIFFRLSNESESLSNFSSLWEQLDAGDLSNFIPTQLFIATWYQVVLYSYSYQPTEVIPNTFQVVLATDTVKTVAMFIYDDIKKGSGAQVGFNSGDGYSSYLLPGALSPETIYLDQVTNCGKTGVLIYRIDNLGLVECSTTIDCTNSDLGIMTTRDCCIDNPNGLSYTMPGSEVCYVCVVFGWYNDSIIGMEGDNFTLFIGCQKGCSSETIPMPTLNFSISMSHPIYAYSQTGDSRYNSAENRLDFKLNKQYVEIDFVNSDTIVLTLNNDEFALEFTESATIILQPTTESNLMNIPSGEGVFYRQECKIEIMDDDVLEVKIQKEEYIVNESEVLSVKVCHDPQVSTQNLNYFRLKLILSVEIIDTTFPGIPENSSFSPNRADIDDFGKKIVNENLMVNIDTYYPNMLITNYEENCFTIAIPINDDDINEADQVFAIALSLPTDVDYQDSITLSQYVSIGWIIDNDPIAISFEQPSYTFIEPPIDSLYTINLLKNRKTEQTFLVTIKTQTNNISDRYQPAIPDKDYHSILFDPYWPPGRQIFPNYWLYLFNDDSNITEENKKFIAFAQINIPQENESFLSGMTDIIIVERNNIIEFSQKIFVIQESNDVEITIYSYSSVEDLTIKFSTSTNGGTATATEGVDYEKVLQKPIHFSEGNNVSLTITIIDDKLAEGLEVFYGELVVSGPTHNFKNMITINILDNEDIGVCGNIVEGKNCSENSECTVSSDGREILGCDCIDGYRGSGFICQDIDECANRENSCDPQNALCTNTNESYECNCKDGYVGNGTLCIETTTAAENKVPGPCGNDCMCIPDSYCTCVPGYVVAQAEDGNRTCSDIDECSSNPNLCGVGSCKNTDGSYSCYCPLGYTFNFTLQSCVDLDECFYEKYTCDSNADCTNTNGSYTCTCKDDYYGDGKTCQLRLELDACTDISANLKGKDCGCSRGFTFDSSLSECEDINECKLPSICDKNALCTNTEGSYTCKCKDGFQGNGIICNDIDECATDLYECDVNKVCKNTEGSYKCPCKPNYFLNGTKCQSNVKPTINDSAPENPTRPNNDLSYIIGQNFCLEDETSFPNGISVHCPLKYKPFPEATFTITATQVLNNGSICRQELTRMTKNYLFLDREDLSPLFDNVTQHVNVTCRVYNSVGDDTTSTIIRRCNTTECQDGGTNNCTQICTRNALTEYECSCNVGYMLNMTNLCSDIDECLNSTLNTCNESNHEMCLNRVGYFECECKPGYEENSNDTCQDIDECADEDICSQNCTNTEGSYHCFCNRGYSLNLTDNYSCHDIDECLNSTLNTCNASNHEMCLNRVGYFECECKPGYEENSNDTCQDIDECMNAGICSQNCTNTEGSYYCFCNTGYDLNTADNYSCHDVDECDKGDHLCHAHADCTNNNGSYTCSCKRYYTGNGYNCEIEDKIKIASGLGSVLLFMIIMMVLTVVLICYYVRHSPVNGFVNSENDHIDFEASTKDKRMTVQSSYKLQLPPNLIITSSVINLVEPIGQGEFGIVYKGYIVKNLISQVVSELVAIKTLKGFYDSAAVRELLKESSKMCKFDHPNVLTLTGVCLDGGPAPFIIMPFMANGSLLAYLKKNRASLIISSEEDNVEEVELVREQLLDMCIQVARGMEYLAMMKVVHRDLAARNCMIDTHFVIKIADFGLTESIETKDYFRQDKNEYVKLPLKWMAPESIRDYIFSEKSDVWAYGVTCWEIFTGGHVPYPTIDLAKLPRLLTEGHRLEKPDNGACSDEIYITMMHCWEYEPTKRPSFSALVDNLSHYLHALADYLDIGGSKLNLLDTNQQLESETHDEGVANSVDRKSLGSGSEEVNFPDFDQACSTENLCKETSF